MCNLIVPICTTKISQWYKQKNVNDYDTKISKCIWHLLEMHSRERNGYMQEYKRWRSHERKSSDITMSAWEMKRLSK